jgi:hypothetical protein
MGMKVAEYAGLLRRRGYFVLQQPLWPVRGRYKAKQGLSMRWNSASMDIAAVQTDRR